MQKQHANTRIIATKAIETMAHDGTVGKATKDRVWIQLLGNTKK